MDKVVPSVLFVGPVVPPVNGQSVAFTTAYEGYPGAKSVVDTSTAGGTVRRLWQYGAGLLRTAWAALVTSREVVYFTGSRTYQGSLRDVLLVNIASRRGRPVVNHLHGADMRRFYTSSVRPWRWILRRTYARVDKSIILLAAMEREFSDWVPGMELPVVSNCYPPELDLVAKEAGDELSYRMVYLSNLMYSKGIIDLLEAFRILRRRYPDLELDVAGKPLADDHYDLAGINQELKAYEDDPGVNILGGVYGEAKARLLLRADIFVLPSFYKSEALPISILEAMRAGCAVVTTRHNYLPDFVTEKMGRLVPTRAPGKIAEAISALYEHTGQLRAIKRANQKYAAGHHAQETYVSGVVDVLRATAPE